MTTINELEDQIFDWVKSVSLYDDDNINWQYEEMPMPQKDFIHLNLLEHSVTTTKNHRDDGILENIHINSVLLSLNIYGEQSKIIGLKLLKSLNTDTVLQLFGDIGYTTPDKLQNLTIKDSDNKQVVKRHMLSIPFSFEEIEEEDLGYFDKLEITGIIKNFDNSIISENTNIYQIEGG